MNAGIKALMHTIATMRVGHCKNEEICRITKLSVPGLYRIYGLDEYKQIEDQVLLEHAKRMGSIRQDSASEVRDLFRREKAVPEALRSVVEIVKQRKDLRASLAAAREILDRDPDKSLPNQTKANAPVSSADQVIDPKMLSTAVSEADNLKIN